MPGWVEPARKPSRRPPDPDPLASTMPRTSAAPINGAPSGTAPVRDPFAADTPTAEQRVPSAHATPAPQPPAKQALTAEERELAKQLWAALEALSAQITAAPTAPPKAAPAPPRRATNVAPPIAPPARVVPPTVDLARQRRMAKLTDDLHQFRRWIVDMDVAHVRPVGSPLPQFLTETQLNLLAHLVANESHIRAGEPHFAERTWSGAEFEREVEAVNSLWYALGQISEQLHCSACGAAGTFSRRPPANRDERHGIGDHKRLLTQCATCGQMVCFECLQDGQCRQCRKSQRGGLFGRRRG